MHNIFIYGTLKRGYPNHNSYLDKENYLGSYRTVECYPLVIANKWFAPVMLHEPGQGKQVLGELYQVDDDKLAELDRLERTDHSKGYQRISIEIRNIANDELTYAFTYMKERIHVDNISSEYLAEYTDRRYIPVADRV